MILVDRFRQHILESGIIDPEGVHHEFAYGKHGQKIDFGLIAEGSSLFDEWIEVNVSEIRQRYPKLPFAVLGIDKGTIRLAKETATQLGIIALCTKKLTSSEVCLTEESRVELTNNEGGLIVALEDVGTTGGTVLTGVRSVQETGDHDVEVQFTWQRTPELTAFRSVNTPYNVLINALLPTYTAEQCITEGFCAQGWRLIPHGN